MTDTRYDRAPGDRLLAPPAGQGTSSGVLVQTIGLALAAILTATSLWIMTNLNDSMMLPDLTNSQMQP